MINRRDADVDAALVGLVWLESGDGLNAFPCVVIPWSFLFRIYDMI